MNSQLHFFFVHNFAAAEVLTDSSKFTTLATTSIAQLFIGLPSSAMMLGPSVLPPCPSVLSSPLLCQSAVLGYSTALGVVSALLIISLVGHFITVTVVIMLKKKRQSFCTERYQ